MAFKFVKILPQAVAAATKQGTDIAARLLELQVKLQQNPMPSGVDYEPYKNSRDPKFRTARLTDWARALIWQLSDHEVVVFDVVPNHEKAEQASRSKECRIHPLTGELQFRTITEVEVTASADGDTSGPIGLQPFVGPGISDTDLKQLGFTPELIAVGRGLAGTSALEALRRLVPAHERQFIAMDLLGSGATVEEVFQDIVAIGDTPIDTTDFSSALVRSLKNQKLQVLASQAELAEAIEKPWDSWRTYLHEDQRALAYAKKYNGPFRVTGGPGTGKSVVAVHRVRALAENLGFLGTGKPILLTTFNTTMVASLEQLVKALLDDGQQKLVEVSGIDRLALAVLKAANHPHANLQIIDGSTAVDSRIQPLRATHGISMEASRIRTIWEQVLLSMPHRSWDSFQELRKKTKGIPSLDEQEFNRVEALCSDLEAQLEKEGRWTHLLRVRDALDLPVPASVRFEHVIVDEAQDLHALHWRFIRGLVPTQANDIFLVGDSDQRIYRSPYPLSFCGINIRNRSRQLKVSYRCSELILDFAYRILGAERGEDPDATDALARPTALFSGPAPATMGATSNSAELRNLVAKLKAWNAAGIAWGEMLISAPTNAYIEAIVGGLTQHGIPARAVGANEAPGPDVIGVMTLFRVKGMESRVAAVVGASDVLLKTENVPADEIARTRQALFVAATRAREQLFVSWHGKPSALLLPVL